MTASLSHPATLTFSRLLPAGPARVYDALTDPRAREVWSGPDADSIVVVEDGPPPAEGLRERSRCGPRDNPYVTVLTDWVILDPAVRVTYAETLVAEGAHLGVTLATADLAAEGDGTRLDLTLQIVSYVGEEMLGEFEGGWTHAIESLAKYLSTVRQG